MVVGVIFCLCAILSLLAWIGWRYFMCLPAPQGVAGVAVVMDESPRKMAEPGTRKSAATVRLLIGSHSSLWLALLLVGVTAASVLAFSAHISLDPLKVADLDRQQHIQGALNPEALVPPPALPPSVFVGAGRPGLEHANRDWSRLDPTFMNLALQVFARMEARGYPLALLEGYRSPERQDVLADSPSHVTNARAFQSKHQYGLALDAAPIKDGRLVISEKDSWAMQAYLALGEEAERVGLIWGGRWRLRDYGHIEAPGLVPTRLKGN